MGNFWNWLKQVFASKQAPVGGSDPYLQTPPKSQIVVPSENKAVMDKRDERAGRPKQTLGETLRILDLYGAKGKVRVLAVRGYYADTYGKKGQNDRRYWDDAFFLVGPNGEYLAFNGNTDPNGWRAGRGSGSSKGMASLLPGKWSYKIGPHKSIYPAGNQAGAVTVMRDADPSVANSKIVVVDGQKFYLDTGWFGINLHPGSSSDLDDVGRTSSLGCQTWWPPQWKEFISTLVKLLKDNDMKTFEYVLHHPGAYGSKA